MASKQRESRKSKGTMFMTPVSLAKSSAKPTAKPLPAKARSAKPSPKPASVKPQASSKLASSQTKERVNQITEVNDGGTNTNDKQPALKNAYRKMFAHSLHLLTTQKENRFSQQRIPACTPLLTVGSALPFFVLITVAFGAIGFILWQLNCYAVEYTFDYTDCLKHDTHPPQPCSVVLDQRWSSGEHHNATNDQNGSSKESSVSDCHCELTVTLNHSIPWNVYIYYRIDSLYQSYLPYSESIDETQLNGHLNGSEEVCGAHFTRVKSTNTPIAPCGMIANSLFNDTIVLYKLIDHPKRSETYQLEVPLFSTGITWTPKYAVKNPPVMHSCPANMSKLQCAFNGTAPPPNWHRHIWELDPEDAENNGYKNERLLSWMRFAPFGSFRKLYGRVDHQMVKTVPNQAAVNYFFGKTLSNGTYLLNITYNYPVTGFGGRKAIIISNTTWLGGKSPFLAYLFIITSIVCLVITVIFYFVDRKYGKLSEEVYSFVRDKSTQRQRQADSDLLERVEKHSAK